MFSRAVNQLKEDLYDVEEDSLDTGIINYNECIFTVMVEDTSQSDFSFSSQNRNTSSEKNHPSEGFSSQSCLGHDELIVKLHQKDQEIINLKNQLE
jgi:hypothetical protein